jgi:hypothetical protein
MRGSEEASNRPECAWAPIIVSLYVPEVLVHDFIGSWVPRIGRRAETDWEGEDVLANLVRLHITRLAC